MISVLKWFRIICNNINNVYLRRFVITVGVAKRLPWSSSWVQKGFKQLTHSGLICIWLLLQIRADISERGFIQQLLLQVRQNHFSLTSEEANETSHVHSDGPHRPVQTSWRFRYRESPILHFATSRWRCCPLQLQLWPEPLAAVQPDSAPEALRAMVIAGVIARGGGADSEQAGQLRHLWRWRSAHTRWSDIFLCWRWSVRKVLCLGMLLEKPCGVKIPPRGYWEAHGGRCFTSGGRLSK